MYIMKIRGVNNMPDFVQVRDDMFTLIAYFRADRPGKNLSASLDNLTEEELKDFVQNLPYGQIRKIR
jgi:hypothetical protein